jgi:hypothetical protein
LNEPYLDEHYPAINLGDKASPKAGETLLVRFKCGLHCQSGRKRDKENHADGMGDILRGILLEILVVWYNSRWRSKHEEIGLRLGARPKA